LAEGQCVHRVCSEQFWQVALVPRAATPTRWTYTVMRSKIDQQSLVPASGNIHRWRDSRRDLKTRILLPDIVIFKVPFRGNSFPNFFLNYWRNSQFSICQPGPLKN